MPTHAAPEQWHADAGEAGVAQLDIPPDAQRERVFEVFCTLEVRRLASATEPWHQLQVLVNGSQQWLRREPTHEGAQDLLDYHFRCPLPVGEPLRISASSALHGARQLRLRIHADEN